jgi:hypothetical protein
MTSGFVKTAILNTGDVSFESRKLPFPYSFFKKIILNRLLSLALFFCDCALQGSFHADETRIESEDVKRQEFRNAQAVRGQIHCRGRRHNLFLGFAPTRKFGAFDVLRPVCAELAAAVRAARRRKGKERSRL